MSLPTLLNGDDPSWGFENQQQHQMANGSAYILDPDEIPDGGWRQDHQFAHDDMMNPPPDHPVFGEAGGFPPAQNFYDIDPTDPRAMGYWTWTHHQEHYLQQALTPLS